MVVQDFLFLLDLKLSDLNQGRQRHEEILATVQLFPLNNPVDVTLAILWIFSFFCEDLHLNHVTATIYRSKTNAIAERVVQRDKEGTTSVPVLSVRSSERWDCAMKCDCYFRNIQDHSSDGRTPHEKRFNAAIDGPIIPFGEECSHDPNWTDDVFISLAARCCLASSYGPLCIREDEGQETCSLRTGMASKRTLPQKSTSKGSSPKKGKSPQFRKHWVFPFADGSIEQDGHAEPRSLHLRLLRQEED